MSPAGAAIASSSPSRSSSSSPVLPYRPMPRLETLLIWTASIALVASTMSTLAVGILLYHILVKKVL